MHARPFREWRLFTTIAGSVAFDPPNPCYMASTGTGQTATLKFIKPNGNVAFRIDGLVEDRESYSCKTQRRPTSAVSFSPPGSAHAIHTDRNVEVAVLTLRIGPEYHSKLARNFLWSVSGEASV